MDLPRYHRLRPAYYRLQGSRCRNQLIGGAGGMHPLNAAVHEGMFGIADEFLPISGRNAERKKVGIKGRTTYHG